jgi:hypothetical protein
MNKKSCFKIVVEESQYGEPCLLMSKNKAFSRRYFIAKLLCQVTSGTFFYVEKKVCSNNMAKYFLVMTKLPYEIPRCPN